MSNWKVKDGQKLDTNALPSGLRNKASIAFANGTADKSRTAHARQEIADYFQYVADSRGLTLAKVVHAFKTGRLGTIAPSNSREDKDGQASASIEATA